MRNTVESSERHDATQPPLRRLLVWLGLAATGLAAIAIALSATALTEFARDARIEQGREMIQRVLRHRLEEGHRAAARAALALATAPLAERGAPDDPNAGAPSLERQLERAFAHAASGGFALQGLTALDPALRPIMAERLRGLGALDWPARALRLREALARGEAIAAWDAFVLDRRGAVVHLALQPLAPRPGEARPIGYVLARSDPVNALAGAAATLGVDLQIRDVDGRILLEERPLATAAGAGGLERPALRRGELLLRNRSGLLLYRIAYWADDRAFEARLAATRRSALIGAVALALIAWSGAIWLVRRTVLRPIAQTEAAIAAIADARAPLSTAQDSAEFAKLDARLRALSDHVARTSGLERELTKRNALLKTQTAKRRVAEARSRFLLEHDDLTGLPNAHLFADRLAQALALRARAGVGVAVMAIDLDRFNRVNDALGVAGGDAVLRAAAQRLAGLIGPGDSVARLGGDEFAVAQLGFADPRQCDELARKIVTALSAPFEVEGRAVSVGASVGVAVADEICAAPGKLMSQASLALCDAKASGRRGHRFFEAEMQASQRERQELEDTLARAIETDGFRLLYQPVFRILPEGVRMIGVEALLRCRHPEQGLLSPEKFVPIAEQSGQIAPIGAWALMRACADIVAFEQPLRVAVNLSPVQIYAGGVFDAVDDALKTTGLPAERLELEITEGVILHDDDVAKREIERLTARGVRIAMDDFGAGYASLGYLRKFPFSKIKIDRAFVSGDPGRGVDAPIVAAVVQLGRACGMTINAEGVETDAQLQRLRELGCAEVQGFHLSRPLPLRRLRAFVERQFGRQRVGAV